MNPSVYQYCSKFLGRRVLIVGFSLRTGLSATIFFEQLKISYSIYDQKNIEFVKKNLNGCQTDYLKDIFTGQPRDIFLKNIDAILLSPGVPRTNPLIVKANKLNIKVVGDLDLIFPLLKKKVTIGVTGTDGKTTTVNLLKHLLKQKHKVVACGNNGVPILNVMDEIEKAEIVIIEISSYMLEQNQNIIPSISIITNIDQDHLDRYSSFEKYRQTKFKILDGEGIAMINQDDENINHQGTISPRKKIFIGKNAEYGFNEKELIIKNDTLVYKEMNLKGICNRYNMLFAIATSHVLGLSFDLIKKGITTFEGLPHRLEFVVKKNNIEVYNDSKATTLQAVKNALLSFRSCVLIMGGQGKGIHYEELKYLRKRVKKLFTYGEEGLKIKMTLGWEGEYIEKFSEVVKKAWRICEENDVLLLSPGASSFDQFSNFEERGLAFKKIIHEI